ncbi:peptidylprolyl isomerase [Ramlibacter albus]|uniref:Periplasmic chaperone PpiD n=1 Tax=Ramlibacter albus TaxID=2079448 RepID=A0A923S397_9BURK|nr:SurA N-terminal domain-containing protein [Ramlibacter albus]MBC5766191.1 SurA N-terminal domain-containing protein [Ramlibacter albus]
MFDFVRKHNKIMQFMLFLLVVPSFVFFGISGYDRMREKGSEVARVDGREITQSEWDNQHKVEVDRIHRQIPNLEVKFLDTPEAKWGSLENIVRERVILAAANDSHLVTSDQRLERNFFSSELGKLVIGPDGKVDKAKLQQVLSGQGMSPRAYEEQLRADLSARQVLNPIDASAMPATAPADVALGAFHQKREIQVARFNATDFAARVSPTDAELEAYYKANPQQFMAPERATIEYVVLDVDAVKKGITINEADLKTYYEQNAQRLAGKEERRASHILITADKGAAADVKAKAKAKAEELAAQARKNPASFAELAKKNSQDPGSAAQGGDLDFFQRGAMTKPFEEAVFAAKKGDIVGPVETEFGYHVIMVTDIKSQQAKTFEQVKPELEAELQKQQAARKYAEAAETFTNTVYEQSDSLKPVADKLKLEVRKAENVTRQPQAGQPGPLANPKFLAAIFGPDAVEKKRNTEALEVAPQQMVSGRIVQYTPARAKPFAEVKDEVRARVVAQRSAEMAKKEGEQKLAAWKAAPATADMPPAVVLSRNSADKFPPALVDGAMRADPSKLPALVGVDLGNLGYAVVKINRVLPREAPPADQAMSERQQYAKAFAGAETLAYYNLLKERFKVQYKVTKPATQ